MKLAIILTAILTLAPTAYGATKIVEGHASGFLDDGDPIAETLFQDLQQQADAQAAGQCLSGTKAFRIDNYNNKQTRVDHGFLHGYKVFVTAHYSCENPTLTGFMDKVKCTVTSVNGLMSSFRPPVVGDTITIDAAQNSITTIGFNGGNMIPVLVPLQRNQDKAVPVYVASFSADQEDSDVEKLSLVLMVGKFFDGSKNVYEGEIQNILTTKATGLVRVEAAKLACDVQAN